jgi:hypothetical protein
MLSIRKKIAASASLVLATAGVVAFVQSASPATSVEPASSIEPTSSAARQKAAVRVSVVPGVIGPGKSLQKSGAAKWAVIGKYSPNKVGKKARLQKLSGTSWVTAGKVKIDKKGVALFAVPPAFASKPVTYRVDGPGAPSQPVITSEWGTTSDFADDFGGSRLNLTDWQHRQGEYYPESKRTCAKGSPKAVKVSRGTAKLSVLVDKNPPRRICKPKKPGKNVIFGKFKYRLNANIGTQATHSIKYGVVAARIKFQPLQGQHASLWLQPTYLHEATTTGREVDIIEWFGKDVPNGGLTSFIYAPSLGGDKLGIGPRKDGWIGDPEQYLMNEKDDWYKRYHVFSVEWTPSAYIFRIDGQETGRITKRVGNATEYPILSILSSDYELSKLPGRDEKRNLPQTMYVDWIKTWQNPGYSAIP